MSPEHLLITGFPGFLGSALLPRILGRRPGARALCVVQEKYLGQAGERLADLARTHPQLRDRVDLLAGDITLEGIGIDPADARLRLITEVWHLAAVYDPAVQRKRAESVNIRGTEKVIALCRDLPSLARLHYVSTCYLSGDYPGAFAEDDLDVGQTFRNSYEATKFGAELRVREAMRAGLPATIYRPGMIVGDSGTGGTQKFDGPYYVASLLMHQPRLPLVARIAFLPQIGDPDLVKVWLVPRDFVIAAIDELSCASDSLGRTYALADPNPPTVREVADAFAERLGKRVVWVPLPLGPTKLLLGAVPLAERLTGVPPEALDYLTTSTSYDTSNAEKALAGAGIQCPPFAEYSATLIDFMQHHPEIDGHGLA